MAITKTKKYLISLGVIALAILIVSAFKSNQYTVQTKIKIEAPARLVFNIVNDLSTQEDWNAKSSLDSSYRVTCLGKTFGKDASCDYVSRIYNNGVMRISVVNSGDSISITEEPQGKAPVIYSYLFLSEDTTHCIVQVNGSSQSSYFKNLWNFIHRWKLKKHINHQLDNLKVFAQNRFKNKMYNGLTISEQPIGQRFYLIQKEQVAPKDISQFYTQNIAGLYQKALEHQLAINGNPSLLYYSDIDKDSVEIVVGLPTLAAFTIQGAEAVSIPEGHIIRTTIQGDRNHLSDAYRALDSYMLDYHLKSEYPYIEEYNTDPSREPDPTKWTTHIIRYVTKK